MLLLLTFFWAVYTFVWKEHVAPSLQKPKVEIDSAIDTLGATNSGLIRLVIKVKNTGNITIYPLQDNWAIYNLVRVKPGTEKEFLKRLDTFLEKGNGNGSMERASIIKPGAILATGSLPRNDYLNPGESARLSKLVKLPAGTKEIYFRINLPYSSKLKSDELDLVLRWTYNRSDGFIWPIVCKAETENAIPVVKRTCYGSDSQEILDWQKNNKIESIVENESYAVQSSN
jgi:hypothetical protein